MTAVVVRFFRFVVHVFFFFLCRSACSLCGIAEEEKVKYLKNTERVHDEDDDEPPRTLFARGAPQCKSFPYERPHDDHKEHDRSKRTRKVCRPEKTGVIAEHNSIIPQRPLRLLFGSVAATLKDSKHF